MLTGDRTTIEKDSLGREHLKMSFHVSSLALTPSPVLTIRC